MTCNLYRKIKQTKKIIYLIFYPNTSTVIMQLVSPWALVNGHGFIFL